MVPPWALGRGHLYPLTSPDEGLAAAVIACSLHTQLCCPQTSCKLHQQQPSLLMRFRGRAQWWCLFQSIHISLLPVPEPSSCHHQRNLWKERLGKQDVFLTTTNWFFFNCFLVCFLFPFETLISINISVLSLEAKGVGQNTHTHTKHVHTLFIGSLSNMRSEKNFLWLTQEWKPVICWGTHPSGEINS